MKHQTAFVAAAPLVLALCAAAQAGDPQGPAFGNCTYAASIKKVCSLPDTDDYVASLVAGEKLSVTLKNAKGSALVPRLTLVGPDGTEFAPPLAVGKGGTSLSLKSFVVPATGRWCVRVAGQAGTEGAYTAAFAVAAAPSGKARNIEATVGSDTVVPFDGIEGASLDLTATWRNRKTPVALMSIETPAGIRITDFTDVVKSTSLSVKRMTLHGGDGTYKLHFDGVGGATKFDVATKVTPQGRPNGKKAVALADSEPFLDDLGAPVRGAPGVAVRMTGGNFSSKNPPTVLFGSIRGTATALADGKSLDVVPPDLVGGATVSVSVIGPDGQSCVRDAYFYCVPAPVVTDLVDVRGMPARVGPLGGGVAFTLRGTNFETGQTVRFGAASAQISAVSSPTQMRIVAPAGTGLVSVSVDDAFGRTAQSSFQFAYLPPPSIVSVGATGGVRLDSTHVPAGGGAVVTILGANLSPDDVVTVAGVPATLLAAADGGILFTAPAAPVGAADVVVTDSVGQSVVSTRALQLVGWTDATADRAPAATAVDDFSALRGVVGDLDGDGVADDLVLVSDATSPGTRAERTRVFFGASGALDDLTATRFPAAFSDPAHADQWRARAVTLGDFDGDGSTDVVIGGAPVPSGGADAFEARLFSNDGQGAFFFDGASPRVRSAAWNVVENGTGSPFALFSPDGANGGKVAALAAADLDGDGDREIIVATDHFRTGALHFPLSSTTFAGDDATASNVAAQWDPTGTTYDSPALRIFDNRRAQGAGFVDATFTRLPRGDVSPGTQPAYHARDVKVADIDGDGKPDIVVTWDDPTTVTPYGLANPGVDEPRVATRVLINSGNGFFTDQTSSWMPAGSGDEFWQADRVVLADLDGDGDLDMVLVHHASVDAYRGSPTHSRSALRILRNDGPGVGFVDVTASALPSMPLAGTYDDDLRGTALAVFDFDGDGIPDIVVGTTQRLTGAVGGVVRSLRLLHGGAGLTFSDASAFLPSTAVDTGEADDVLLAKLSGGDASLVLVTDAAPDRSAGGARLRVLDWSK